MPILRLALPKPLRRLFDYLPPEGVDLKALVPGVRVLVPFQSHTVVGVLIEVAAESAVPLEKLKQALAILDTKPLLSDDIYKLCQWAADYYHYALGEVLASALPALLRKGKPAEVKPKKTSTPVKTDTPRVLNTAQQQAVDVICAAHDHFRILLLDGVTGSGKTEVYLQAMADVLLRNQQVLVLVPEISLTPQTIARFQARFPVSIAILHSNLSETERLRTWLHAQSGNAKIVIGTRSAIFTPFAKLGLIIVDEEHDTSFKQQERFRYHARDLAIMRASINHIPAVLGSATPSLESLHNAKRGRYDYLLLPERAGNAQLPQYQFVDLRGVNLEEGLSPTLLETMHTHLENDNQVMLFLNRRGFAPVYYCTSCAWIADCRRCDARLVHHHQPPRLQCHQCDAHHAIPTHCTQCHQDTLKPVGVGTERLEQALINHFPDIPIIRVDRDSTKRKGAIQQLLAEINTHQKAILLGTQMLAKGHHFPHVTLVGIIDADSGLFSADFRASEQMGQLLLQVAGRAGREEKTGTVLIQTHYPEHPLLQTLIREGYANFANTLLNEREEAHLPPFSYFALFRAESYQEQKAIHFLSRIKNIGARTPGITLLGPVPALLAKRKGLYCHHLLARTKQRRILQQWITDVLQQIEKWPASQTVKWALDVDPIEVV